MQHWDDGYYTQSTYTHGYFRELAPVFQRFCLLLHGFVADAPAAPQQHCELGFGQGVSAAIHAAATPGHYWGTDFNPAHAAHANALCQGFAEEAHLFDNSFAELLTRGDLPPFDSISLHGVWSWINRENQAIIVEFVRKFLKPGGVLYISYNCWPGHAHLAPLRALLHLSDTYSHRHGSTKDRVTNALDFAQKLLEARPNYARAVPEALKRLEYMRKQGNDYLAHEYLNADWMCMYFAEVAEQMQAGAKCAYACSASPLDGIEIIHLREDGRAFLAGIADPLLREQARDYFVNRQFRKDVFMRGARQLPPTEALRRLLDTPLALMNYGEVPLTLTGTLGTYTLHAEKYTRMLDWFREHRVGGTLAACLAHMPDISPAAAREMCAILVGKGVLHPCQSPEAQEAVLGKCARLNATLCQRAAYSNDINYLASPVIGGGLHVNRLEQLFLKLGMADPAALAEAVWGMLHAQGQRLVHDGRTLESEADNREELQRMAGDFLEKRLPLLRALHVTCA